MAIRAKHIQLHCKNKEESQNTKGIQFEEGEKKNLFDQSNEIDKKGERNEDFINSQLENRNAKPLSKTLELKIEKNWMASGESTMEKTHSHLVKTNEKEEQMQEEQFFKPFYQLKELVNLNNNETMKGIQEEFSIYSDLYPEELRPSLNFNQNTESYNDLKENEINKLEDSNKLSSYKKSQFQSDSQRKCLSNLTSYPSFKVVFQESQQKIGDSFQSEIKQKNSQFKPIIIQNNQKDDQSNEQESDKTPKYFTSIANDTDQLKQQPSQINLEQEQPVPQKQKMQIESKQFIRKDSFITPLGAKHAQPQDQKKRIATRAFTLRKRPHTINRMNETWKQRGLFILFFVRKFIVYLRNISQQNKFRNLSKNQFDLMNDYATDSSFYKFGNYLVNMKPTFLEKLLFIGSSTLQKSVVSLNSRFLYTLNNFLQHTIIIISPESTFKLIWDGFVLFLLIINVFYIPLKIAFEESGGLQLKFGLNYLLDVVPGWIFLSDIILSFNTSFYKKGMMITERPLIVKHYLKNQFFWDLFVLIPFIVSLYFEIKYLDGILLLRYNKIRKIANNYLELMNLRNEQAAIWDLMKLIIFILFIAHFCGCAFYLVSYLEVTGDLQLQDISQNWLDKFYKVTDAHTYPWYSNYITCFYWAVITMITVGYGDISPNTDWERVFVIIITLIACGVFAYSVNSIGNIVGAITQKATQFKQKMSLLSIHMKKRGLSTELQMKVKKYFEYINDEMLEDNQEGENMLNQLAASLKNEIALEIYGKILNSKKLFKLNFSQAFIMDLAPKLKERRLGPEEFIFSKNESMRNIFFVMKGDVNLFLDCKYSKTQPLTIIKQINKGGLFGEISFFSGMVADHGAVTQNVVSLVYLTLDDFLEVIKNHPIDNEKYSLIKDNFNMYSSSRGLGSQCCGCGKFTHQINKCPMINYVPNQDQIIEKYKKSDETQQRSSLDRSNKKISQKKGKNPLLQLEELKRAAIEMIVEVENITEVDELIERLDQLEEPAENLSELEKDEKSSESIIIWSHEQADKSKVDSFQDQKVELSDGYQRQMRKGSRKQSIY